MDTGHVWGRFKYYSHVLIGMGVKLDKESGKVIISDLEISNPEVFALLEDKENPEEWLLKALAVGSVGLKQMVVTDRVDFVEKEFGKFMNYTRQIFDQQSQKLNEELKEQNKILNEQIEDQKKAFGDRIDETFSIERSDSPIAKFTSKLDSTFDSKNVESPLYQLYQVMGEYFDSESGKLKEMIDHYFSVDEGQMKRMLDGTFDLDNANSPFFQLIEKIKSNSDIEEETIKKLLDPNATDSPAEQMKRQIFEKFADLRERDIKDITERIKEIRTEELKDIKEHLTREEAKSEEREKGTQKGFDFEEKVYEELETFASAYEDKVSRTGDVTAGLGKVGDIVVDVEGGKRLVVECKNANKNSCKDVTDEVVNALENRNADFAIYLFSDKDKMPGPFQPIKITDSFIITYMGGDNLYFAYRLARILLSQNGDSEGEVDVVKIRKELERVEESVRNVDNMQAKVTSILNSGKYLRDNLDNLKRDVERGVYAVKLALVGKEYSNEVESGQRTLGDL